MNGLEFIIIVTFAIFSFVIALLDIKIGSAPRIAFIVAFSVFFTLNILKAEYYPLLVSIAGMLIGLFVFFLAFFISKKKLGLADIWYSGLIGLVLGPFWWYPAIGIACLTGVAYLFIFKKRRIPFIPFMAVGSITMFIVQGLFL
jgi:prepilin signal peptidase PulO-like enzyme (type II secretory pathway)